MLERDTRGINNGEECRIRPTRCQTGILPLHPLPTAAGRTWDCGGSARHSALPGREPSRLANVFVVKAQQPRRKDR